MALLCIGEGSEAKEPCQGFPPNPVGAMNCGENNYVFPPPSELPRVAQLLFERPSASATVVAPFWPAQAWFQQLTELAICVETHALAELAVFPAWLHGSARTALSGAMLALFRVEGRPAGATDRRTRA